MRKTTYGLILFLILLIVSCSNNQDNNKEQKLIQETDQYIKNELFKSKTIDSNFNLPIVFDNGVNVTWISTDESLIKISLNENQAYFKVYRPEINHPNINYNLKYELSLEKENKEEELFLGEIKLTIESNKAPTINNIADVLNLKENEYSQDLDEHKLEVTINNALVIASSNNEHYLYDETGIIKAIYSEELLINEVYNLKGKLKWNEGRWLLLVLSKTKSPININYPDYINISNIDTYLDQTINNDFLNILNGNPENGNISYEYARVNGKLNLKNNTLILENENNYFIVDENSIDYNLLLDYLNYEVIVNLMITDYNFSLNTFSVLITSTANEVDFENLTPLQKINLDFKILDFQSHITSTTNLNFIRTGKYGSKFEFISSNPNLINVETGLVNIPSSFELVTLNINLSNENETFNYEIVILLGDISKKTIIEVKNNSLDSIVKTEGIFLGYINDDFFAIGNDDGAILVENNINLGNNYNPGDLIEIAGRLDKINDVYVVRSYALLDQTKNNLPNIISLNDKGFIFEQLIDYQSMLTNAYNLEIIEIIKGNDTILKLKTFNEDEISLIINNMDISNYQLGDIINIKNSILTLFEESITLVFTNISELEKIDGKTKETIDLFNSFNLQSTFDDYGQLLLHKKIINSLLVWEYSNPNNQNNHFINLENGAVLVPDTGSVNVGLNASVIINDQLLKREFIIKLNSRPALMYEFDFTDKTDVPNNASTALRETEVTNKVDNQRYTFWREDSTINERNSNLRGVVFNLAKSRQNKTSLFYSDFKVNSLKKIELKIGNWGLDATNNLDDIAKHINVEISTDKTNWDVVKDLKPEWVKSNDSLNTYEINIPNDDDIAYYFKIVVIGNDTEYNANLRLILTNIKFYIKG